MIDSLVMVKWLTLLLHIWDTALLFLNSFSSSSGNFPVLGPRNALTLHFAFIVLLFASASNARVLR
jgi:hypothetical protein